jgi:hypothetical protein
VRVCVQDEVGTAVDEYLRGLADRGFTVDTQNPQLLEWLDERWLPPSGDIPVFVEEGAVCVKSARMKDPGTGYHGVLMLSDICQLAGGSRSPRDTPLYLVREREVVVGEENEPRFRLEVAGDLGQLWDSKSGSKWESSFLVRCVVEGVMQDVTLMVLVTQSFPGEGLEDTARRFAQIVPSAGTARSRCLARMFREGKPMLPRGTVDCAAYAGERMLCGRRERRIA